eukprot:3426094-Rhodomonas_salina.1
MSESSSGEGQGGWTCVAGDCSLVCLAALSAMLTSLDKLLCVVPRPSPAPAPTHPHSPDVRMNPDTPAKPTRDGEDVP